MALFLATEGVIVHLNCFRVDCFEERKLSRML